MPGWVRYLVIYWGCRWLKETCTLFLPYNLTAYAGFIPILWTSQRNLRNKLLSTWNTSNWAGLLKKLSFSILKHFTSCRIVFKRTYRKIGFCQDSIKFYFQRMVFVNVGWVIKRPRDWDGSIGISNIPVGTKCFPEVLGQAAAVIHHSTKLFHLQREQAVSQPQKEPPPGVSVGG